MPHSLDIMAYQASAVGGDGGHLLSFSHAVTRRSSILHFFSFLRRKLRYLTRYSPGKVKHLVLSTKTSDSELDVFVLITKSFASELVWCHEF